MGAGHWMKTLYSDFFWSVAECQRGGMEWGRQYSVPVNHFSAVIAAEFCNAQILKNANFHWSGVAVTFTLRARSLGSSQGREGVGGKWRRERARRRHLIWRSNSDHQCEKRANTSLQHDAQVASYPGIFNTTPQVLCAQSSLMKFDGAWGMRQPHKSKALRNKLSPRSYRPILK